MSSQSRTTTPHPYKHNQVQNLRTNPNTSAKIKSRKYSIFHKSQHQLPIANCQNIAFQHLTFFFLLFKIRLPIPLEHALGNYEFPPSKGSSPLPGLWSLEPSKQHCYT